MKMLSRGSAKQTTFVVSPLNKALGIYSVYFEMYTYGYTFYYQTERWSLIALKASLLNPDWRVFEGKSYL